MLSSTARSPFFLHTLFGIGLCSMFFNIFHNPLTKFSSAYYFTEPATLLQATSTCATNVATLPATTPTVWTDISRNLTMNHQIETPQVKTEIRKLLADPEKLNTILTAAAPYIYYIHQQTIMQRLPAELALIPIIESEFNPDDYSNRGATGLWQLMPGTAHELGIKVKANYDGRRNVVVSTTAALAYFKDLGAAFNGDWVLAIAAYNCGEVRIDAAIRRAGSHNFWNLAIPKETKLYIPRLLAVAEVIKNADKYGVTLPEIVNKPYFTQLQITKPVNLQQVAKISGATVATLRKLNPDYSHPVLPVKKGSYLLLVPTGVPTTRARKSLVINMVNI